jgi:hypothetical protein
MPKHSMAKAYKAWLKALEDMRAALTANPVVADPFMASAQVFEDIGRVMFANHTAPKKPRRKPAKAKRAVEKKKKPTPRRARKR